MSNKTYQMETSCPQCGCSAVSHLTADQIKERFGDVPNVDIECSECSKKFQTSMKEAVMAWYICGPLSVLPWISSVKMSVNICART